MSNVKLSKKLSHVLRHGASELGLSIAPDGYVSVRELMRTRNFSGTALKDIEDVVRRCPKQRFEMKESVDGSKFIRATQGHTIKAVESNALLQELNENNVTRYCIHGTYQGSVPSIRSGGLNRMRRNHVHMIEQRPDGLDRVISGMRGSCDTIITVDVHKAMAFGIKFYRSSNGVILSPGLADTGAIPPTFIVNISDRRTYSNLHPGEAVAAAAPAPPTRAKSIAPISHISAASSSPGNMSDTVAEAAPAPLPRTPPAVPPVPPTSDSLASGAPSPPDYYCVIDFEATCLRDKVISPQEIIEFPAVMVDAHTMQTIPDAQGGVFHQYVRPIRNPQLSDFCTELTGITQSTVDGALEFKEVFKMFQSFLEGWGINIYNTMVESEKSVVFVTHGDWDLKTMLPAQCHLSGMRVPYIMKQWGNIKEMYHTLPSRPVPRKINRRDAPRGLGMASMLTNLDMDLIGHHHSGIDDTRNIARILLELGKRGARLGVTWDVNGISTEGGAARRSEKRRNRS